MASKITKQDDKAVEYLESIRKNLGLKQYEMADECEVSLAQYKRYIYKKAKIPAVVFITLAEKGIADCDYLLTGRSEPAKMKFTQILSATDSKDRIAMLYEAYIFLSKRERENKNMKEEKQTRDKKTKGK